MIKRFLRGVVKTVAGIAAVVFFFDIRLEGTAGLVLRDPALSIQAIGRPTRARKCRAITYSLELHYGTVPPDSAFADNVVEARFGCEQPFLETRPGSSLEPFPFFDRHQNGGLNSSSGDELRSLFDGRIQQFTEARLSVLHLPRSHVPPLHTSSFIILTTQISSQLRLGRDACGPG